LIQVSEAAAGAIIAPEREILIKGEIWLVDADAVITGAAASAGVSWSDVAQLYDRETGDGAAVATFEGWHFPLDGSLIVIPEEPGENVGFVSDELSDENGVFAVQPWARLDVTGIDVLQACGVWFGGAGVDGTADSFRVDVYSGAAIVFTRTVTGNTDVGAQLRDFIAHGVTALRVTVLKWSSAYTRARTAEIIPGAYEQWSASNVREAEVYRETDISMLTVPYSTATVTVDNSDKRYDPRNRSGIFKLIEARQSVPLFFGVRLPNKRTEWVPQGIWYMQARGWETQRNGLLMRFNLTDLIGLMRDRRYMPPDVLPGTAGGWVESITASLGDSFAGMYSIDADLGGVALTRDAETVENITCGELLQQVCQAIGAAAKTDSVTGFLRVFVPEDTGVDYAASMMSAYPSQRANSDISSITFKIYGEEGGDYTVSGNVPFSPTTVSVDNPFIHSRAQTAPIARSIIDKFGGQRYEFAGRGDLRSELGDLDAIAMSDGKPAAGRRWKHQLKINERGVMSGVVSALLQPVGAALFSTTEIIKTSGVWTAPAGVTTIRVTLIGGGQGGQGGSGGYGDSVMYWWGPNETDGRGGAGGMPGKVWTDIFDINPEQSFSVVIGAGGTGGAGGAAGSGAYNSHGGVGAPGSPGGATAFGPYSSANGAAVGEIVDIASGYVYAKQGGAGADLQDPARPGGGAVLNSGSGGNGGGGGAAAIYEIEMLGNDTWKQYLIKRAVAGAAGGRGGSGVILVSYNAVS
jgi:hypothetical protein